MLKKLAEFFRSPSFPDDEKTRLARILYTTQIALVAAALLAALGSFRLGQRSSVEGILAACLVFSITIWLTRRGFLLLASWIILLATSISLTFLLYVGQGIHDIAMMLFPMVIIMGSLLFNRLEFGILNVAVFACIIFIVHAEVIGVIQTEFSQFTQYTDLIFLALEQALVAIVTRLLARNITRSLNRARHNELILAEANRKLSEQTESLRASQELLAEAQRIGNIGHFKWDLDNNHMTWSDQMYHIHDLEPGQIEITPEVAWGFIHPDDRSQTQITDQLMLLKQSMHLVSMYRIITYAGIERQVIRISNLVQDGRGADRIVIGTLQDITERERTEISLQRYAHRLEVLRQLDYAILAARSVNEIALEAVQRIRELVPCWRASISTFDFKTKQATMIAFCERDEPAQTASVHLPLANFLDMPTLQNGQPVYTDFLASLGEDKPAAKRLLKEGTLSILGLPIIIQDDLVGSLNLEANQAAAFVAEHIEIGQEVTGLLGISLQQARLAAQTNEALERETRLNALARAISSTLDLPLLLQGIVHLAIELVGADAGTLSLVSEDNSRIVELYDWNIPQPLNGVHMPEDQGATWVIIKSGQPQIANDYASYPDAIPALVEAGISTLVGVPVIAGEICLGALILLGNSPTKIFSQRDLALLESVGRQAGIAIQNARLYNALQEELTERLRAEEALQQREAILSAVTFAARQFLETPDWRANIEQVLGRLGKQIGACHAYIMETQKQTNGNILLVKKYEWNAAEALSRPLSTFPLYELLRYRQILERGEPFYIHISAFTPEEAELCNPLGIKSLLEVPIFLDNYWWGVIGFDDCLTERQWSTPEIDAIVLAAEIIRASIQRQKAEEETRQLNIILEQRVRERTAELEASNRELEAFSYSVSHDLRAPLRGIDGYSKLLMDDYESVVDTEGKFYLQSIRNAAQKMGQLIDDLLQLSRVTRIEMHRTTVSLSALAGEMNTLLQEQEPKRQIEIIIQPGMDVQGDANLLRIMLQNLLGNAWKFTSKVEQACIEVGSQEQNGQCVFFVRDNGAGFDMRYVKRLFSAFQRLHSPVEFEGTGIGLATVQRVITRHGGRIWAEAAVNQGAVFFFTLGE